MPAPSGNELTLLGLPLEVRQMIWSRVFDENSHLMVGHYGEEGYWEPTIRRLIAHGAPPVARVDYPPHPLAYVHRTITADNRDRWSGSHLILSQTRFLPARIFGGITHLSIDMDNAVRHLAAVVPRVPYAHNNLNPPNTHLTLKFAPSIQELEIRWKTTFDRPDANADGKVSVLMARLQYFHRSFVVKVKVSAYLDEDDLGPVALGNLLANPPDFDQNSAFNVTQAQADAFQNRMDELLWDPVCMSDPHSSHRIAVVEAHPYHRYAPLGWALFPYPEFTMPNNFAAAELPNMAQRPMDP